MDYYIRIQAGVDWIEQNLEEPLSIRDIAEQAGFSPFYFQRLFQAISGFSVQGYIRRRRLSEAARRLLETEERIIEIALAYQYQSQEAFTRSFADLFHVTPAKHRRSREALQLQQPLCLIHFAEKRGFHMSKPVLQELEARYICGYEYRTTLEAERHYRDIPGYYEDFRVQERYMQVPDRTPDQAYGVACRFQDDGGFSFVIGGEAEPGTEAPAEGFTVVELPPGLYAAFQNADDIPSIRDYIYGVWLPNSGYERREGPDFEVTDLTKSMQEKRLVITIYIPVCKL